MKKIMYLVLLGIISSTCISSCQKEKDIIPVGNETNSVLQQEEFDERVGVTRRFDNIAFSGTTGFNLPSNPNYFSWAMFNTLNWQTTTGHFIAMYKDNYRNNIHSQGNKLASFIDDLNVGASYMTANEKADSIEAGIVQNTTNTGDLVKTKWIILNEMSRSLWQSNANNYRTWLVNVVKRLKITYNHEVIICTPILFASNYPSAQWQQLSSYGYIAIEGYLSGKAIKAHSGGYGLNTSSGKTAARNWCKQQYKSFKLDYIGQGVPSSKIYLIEHFAQTKANQLNNDGSVISFGRCGVSVADWKAAILVRGQASRSVGFAGFVSYAWSRNWMGASQADLVSFINTYKSTTPF